MSNLSQIRESIQNQWRLLEQQWQATASMWNDPVRLRFERDFLQGYPPMILATLKELDSLAQVIAQAEREVK